METRPWKDPAQLPPELVKAGGGGVWGVVVSGNVCAWAWGIESLFGSTSYSRFFLCVSSFFLSFFHIATGSAELHPYTLHPRMRKELFPDAFVWKIPDQDFNKSVLGKLLELRNRGLWSAEPRSSAFPWCPWMNALVDRQADTTILD